MRKSKKYVVGYDGDNNCVYGKDDEGFDKWINPLTSRQAKKFATGFTLSKFSKFTIYELVKVKGINK